ncbi:LCP family protein [Streptomyces sp. NPDC090112]|uniref:LCP family protein n=1 Tax=Streptomyces sp. NPDC090112 TaxID=3365949 RepID=UPI00380AC01E
MRRLTVALTLLAVVSTGTLSGARAVSAGAGPAAGELRRGTNILVVGIDSRAGLSAAEKRRLHVGGKGCNCTDVMMLVHLSQDRRRASVVSIPRDSYVEYAPLPPSSSPPSSPAPSPEDPGAPAAARKGKINGAYALGGGPLTVKTVEKATGLRVDHYLETDFAGFEKTVDNLGGATVCTDRPLKDENSGLDIAAGVHHTNGNQTLRYVRARHVNLRPGDLGRVRRQQRTVNDLLARLTGDGALSSAPRAAATARTLLKTVRTDPHTGLSDLIGLGLALGRLRADRTEFATVPIRLFDHRVPGVGSTLVWDEPRSAALWDALRADRPITGDPGIQPVAQNPAPTDPARIPVGVDDPAVADALRANGFAVTDTSAAAPAVRPAGGPVIRYPAGREEDADTLAAALPGARLAALPAGAASFTVSVGAEPVQVRAVTYDRNIADGAPVTSATLRCPDLPPRAPAGPQQR